MKTTMKRQTFGSAVERNAVGQRRMDLYLKKKKKLQNEEIGSIEAPASIDTFCLAKVGILVMRHVAFDLYFLCSLPVLARLMFLMSANYGRRLITASYMGPQSLFLYTDCFALIVFSHISLALFQVSTQKLYFSFYGAQSASFLVFVIKLDLTNLTAPREKKKKMEIDSPGGFSEQDFAWDFASARLFLFGLFGMQFTKWINWKNPWVKHICLLLTGRVLEISDKIGNQSVLLNFFPFFLFFLFQILTKT